MFDVVTPGTRATDSDRNETCQALDAALGEGQLSMEEHRERVSAATKATTLGELQALVSDLQIHQAPAQLKSPSSSRLGIWIAAAAVLLVLGLGIGWGMSSNGSSPPTRANTGGSPAAALPSTAPSPTPAPEQLQSAGGLTNLLTQIREKFGDTNGYQLLVYPDYAVIFRVDPRNDRRAVSYDFQNGGWIQIPSGMIPTDTAVADLGKFSVAAVVGAMRDAPQTLKIADPKVTYLIIQGKPGGNLDMSIYVGDTAEHTGYIKIAPDGAVTAIYPPDY
ncbi:DUF1707 domain-containing protein [Mycobacterium fragae]|nr:DUF1707 domain-containing protein [Mycobacterium fragae]